MGIMKQTRFALVAVSLAMLALTNAPVRGGTVFVEPDDFPAGTNISTSFPGITLSVQGDPSRAVHSVSGFSAFNGRNLATTGTLVFGEVPVSRIVPKTWDELFGLLRVDFDSPTDFVQIDMICDDDDVGALRAFDRFGSLLETFGPVACDGRSTPPVTATISRNAPDISYVLAGGVGSEGLFLDNLQFKLPGAIVKIDIKPGSFPNSINLRSNGATPVAILGSASLDVNDIDVSTLTLGTAGIKTVGKVKTNKTGKPLCSVEDVSGDFGGGPEGAPDGFDDLVCHFVTIEIVPEAGNTSAKLSGNFLPAGGGGALEGTDSVVVIGKK